MPASGNQSTRFSNLPRWGGDNLESQKAFFFCGMVQDGSTLPTHAAIATHTTARVRGTQAESKLGRAPLAESKAHDEVRLLGFWKQQGLVIYDWAQIGNNEHPAGDQQGWWLRSQSWGQPARALFSGGVALSQIYRGAVGSNHAVMPPPSVLVSDVTDFSEKSLGNQA